MTSECILETVNTELRKRLGLGHIAYDVRNGYVQIESQVRVIKYQTPFKAITYQNNQKINVPKYRVVEYRFRTDVAISVLFDGDTVIKSGFNHLASNIQAQIDESEQG